MTTKNIFFCAYLRAKRLLIYQEIMRDAVYASFLDLLGLLSEPDVEAEKLFSCFQRFFYLLAERTELSSGEIAGDPWKNHLVELVILTENVFTRKASLEGHSSMGQALLQAVRQDLSILQYLSDLGKTAYEEVQERLALKGWKNVLPDWAELCPLGQSRAIRPQEEAVQKLKKELVSLPDWHQSGLELLSRYYAAHGSGLFGRFWAFRWVRGKDGGHLEGIPDPDLIRLEDLVGYEEERKTVIRNTEKFLQGLPASNILLYGARGTGKSSTVKGLLLAFGGRGLRLIELPKRYLNDYPEILKIVAHQPQKFIIFLDDLSFDEDEVEYRELKGLLEGSLTAKPDNVLVYATSNRRHLVKEYFSDRDAGNRDGRSAEVRQADTLQEKLSLAERFGLTVIFYSPDQEDYLTMVQELARKRGITMPEAELRKTALRWALVQSSFSGRTARQLVDYLYSEQKLYSSPSP